MLFLHYRLPLKRHFHVFHIFHSSEYPCNVDNKLGEKFDADKGTGRQVSHTRCFNVHVVVRTIKNSLRLNLALESILPTLCFSYLMKSSKSFVTWIIQISISTTHFLVSCRHCHTLGIRRFKLIYLEKEKRKKKKEKKKRLPMVLPQQKEKTLQVTDKFSILSWKARPLSTTSIPFNLGSSQ